MAVQLPDVGALGRRPVPRGQRGFAQQDTTAPGEALAGFGQVVGQIGEEFQKREDEQRVLEYRRKLIEWDKANVHDPETGAISKRGKDAFDLPKTLPGQFDTFASEAAKELTSNRQRQIAQEMAIGRREQIGSWAASHALKERGIFDANEYKANISAAQDNALMYPTLATVELENMARATRSYLKKTGAGPEAIDAVIKADASQVHQGIVSKMVKDGNVSGAEAYFKANAAGMNAQSRDVAQSLLKEVGTRQKVQAFEDGLRATDMPLADALGKAREQFVDDPIARDQAVSQVKTLYAEREAVKAQAVKKVSTDAWAVLMEKGAMSAIPGVTMDALRKTAPEEERQMRDWLEAKWRRAKADAEGKKEENWGLYMKLRDMAIEQPDQFVDPQTLLKNEPHLSKQQMSALVGVRDSISRGDLKGMESQRTVKRTLSLVKADIQAAGIDMTPKEGTKKAEETAKFFSMLTQALDAATAEKGKPLTDDEAGRIGRGMVREGIEQGSGIFGMFATKKKGFEMEPGKTYISKRYGDIPLEVRSALANELVARGLATQTRGGEYILGDDQKAAIERAYQRGVELGRFK